MSRTAYALCLALIVVHRPAHGQTPDPRQDVAFASLRFEEDWSVLRDTARRRDPWDGIKYIPFAPQNDPLWYLSFGGDARERIEHYRHQGFGAGESDPHGYLLQRYLLHADVHFGAHARSFAQLQSGIESGRPGGPRPGDADLLGLHQLFADVAWSGLTVRAGRQELEFGTSRLISAQESRNTRQSFDAVRVIALWHDWQAGAFVARPVLVADSIFADHRDSSRVIWGAYLHRTTRLIVPSVWTIYYIGLEHNHATVARGTADARRHTFGVRLAGRGHVFDYNYESGAQIGTFSARPVRAWYAATENAVTLTGVAGQPRVSLRGDATSGDDPRRRFLGSFDAIFDGTPYSGLAGLIGPTNSIDLAPSVTVHPMRRVALTAGYIDFWRESARDGAYGIATNLIRRPGSTDAIAVGDQLTGRADWSATRHLAFSGTISYFHTGAFLRAAPPATDVQYATAWATYRF